VLLTAPRTGPIATAMLPFGNKDSRGGAIHDAEPEGWAKHLRLVRRIGSTEVDPTDTWVRVGDLSPERLAEFKSVLSDVGLTIPAISTSRRSVMDPVWRIVARPLDTWIILSWFESMRGSQRKAPRFRVVRVRPTSPRRRIAHAR
jgi:hypothetical protein